MRQALRLLQLLALAAAGRGGGGSAALDRTRAALMRRCIALAREAEAKGGAPFGALIADPTTGEVLHFSYRDVAHAPAADGHTPPPRWCRRMIDTL